MRQVLGAGALGRPRGVGWGGRWEGGSGWGIHVNPWLSHVNVWQKPLQYCKVISLQLVKNIYIVASRLSLMCPAPVTAAAAKSPQSFPTLYDPRDGSPPSSSVAGILQARTLEWVAVSFSNA